MQTKLKMLQKSRRGQMDIMGLSGFAIALLVVGIVVVVAFLILGSFQTTLTTNHEATAAVNTSITNVSSAFSTIASYLPLIALVVVAGIIITVVVLSFKLGGRRKSEE